MIRRVIGIALLALLPPAAFCTIFFLASPRTNLVLSAVFTILLAGLVVRLRVSAEDQIGALLSDRADIHHDALLRDHRDRHSGVHQPLLFVLALPVLAALTTTAKTPSTRLHGNAMQSFYFTHRCRRQGSNLRPWPYESPALPLSYVGIAPVGAVARAKNRITIL
jgi:hypothetical protein